jgi:hypothetical protein
MPNAYATNQTLLATTEYFNGIWKLSRVLLAAGWKYKASGNGQSGGTKDTSGNESSDTWGVDGAVNLSSASRGTGSGSSVSIGAASATTGLSTITSVSGFTANSVGDYLTITGSAATGGPGTGGTNNGSFRITAQASTTVTVYAPGMVAETGNGSLSVTEQFGGAAASITTFSTTTSGQSTLITVTGLSGLGASDVGRFISFPITSGTGSPASAGNQGTFLIVSVLSSSSALIYNPNAVATDANNGTIQWVEFDTRNQTYPLYLQGANGTGAWIDLQGPTIMKIPIGANVPTGTFIRGENVTQTTTGAQGELLGIVTDSGGATGFLVVAPRVVGTGVQASSVATYGWNSSANTDTVTGGFSGATVTTPVSSTPIAYISELVFWKNTATNGHCYAQRIDQNASTESATSTTTGRFSTLASTLSAVTAQVCPGGSNTTSESTNGFNTGWVGTYVVFGTGGPSSVSTGSATWLVGNSPYTSPGKYQIICANNIEQQAVSADGNWFYFQSCASTGYQGIGYLRMDNQEDGDLDPYVHMGAWSGTLNGAATRAADTSGAGSATDNMQGAAAWIGTAGNHGFKGFRRRGLSSETYNWFSAAHLFDFQGTNYPITTNSGNPDQVGTAVSTTYVREPIWLYLTPFTAQLAAGRMRKGTPRWLQLCEGPAVNSTFDTEQWIVLSSSAFQFVAGPYDGVTTPSF